MEFQQLVVHWGNQILDVQECRVLAKYGEHTKAKVKAIGREEEEKETLIHRSEEKVHIQMRKMQTQGDVLVESLFSGIPAWSLPGWPESQSHCPPLSSCSVPVPETFCPARLPLSAAPLVLRPDTAPGIWAVRSAPAASACP